MRTSAQQEYDLLFKVLIIGNSGVGKSCMLMRYCDNTFTTNFFNTIGVDFKIKALNVGGTNIKMQIWDTAGQDRFKNITTSYYRGAHGIIIVYDITDRDSFEAVKTWMIEIDKYASENVNRLLVANKSDQEDRRKVKKEEGYELAKHFKIPFIECSAKSAGNIETVFVTMAKAVLEKSQNSNKDQSTIKLNKEKNQKEEEKKTSSGGCCQPIRKIGQ